MTGTMNITLTDRCRTEVLGKKKGFRKVTVRFYWSSADTECSDPHSFSRTLIERYDIM